jgi:hypothetical protein
VSAFSPRGAGGAGEPNRAEPSLESRLETLQRATNQTECCIQTRRPEPRRSRTVRAREKKIPKKSHDATDGTTRGPEPRTGADPPFTHAHAPRSRRIGGSRTVGGPVASPTITPAGLKISISTTDRTSAEPDFYLFIFNPSLSVVRTFVVRRSVGPSAAPSPFGANARVRGGGSNQM